MPVQSRPKNIVRFSVCLSLLATTMVVFTPAKTRADVAVLDFKTSSNSTNQDRLDQIVGKFMLSGDRGVTGSVSFGKEVSVPAMSSVTVFHYLIGDWETNQLHHLSFESLAGGKLRGFSNGFRFTKGVFDVDLDFMGQPVKKEQQKASIESMSLEKTLSLIPDRSTFTVLRDSIDRNAGGSVPVATISLEGIQHAPLPAFALNFLAFGTLVTGWCLKRKQTR